MVKVVDDNGFIMQYRYNAQGNLKETEDHLGNIIEVEYDLIGRRSVELGVKSFYNTI
jgi:YD repeat-containing protein